MSTNTRSQTLAGSNIQALANLNDEQLGSSRNEFGLSTVQDLALLETSDFDEILGNENSSFLQRKKLAKIADFVREGGVLSSRTTINDILTFRRMSNSASTSQAIIPSPIKLSPKDFPKFTGKISDQSSYKTRVEALIGQTAFKFLLTKDAETPDEKERDEELYNVFKNSFLDGTVYHVVARSLRDDDGNNLVPSGRRVWKRFLLWCNSGGRKHTLIMSIRKDL